MDLSKIEKYELDMQNPFKYKIKLYNKDGYLIENIELNSQEAIDAFYKLMQIMNKEFERRKQDEIKRLSIRDSR